MVDVDETKGTRLRPLRMGSNFRDWKLGLEFRALSKKEGDITLWKAMNPPAGLSVPEDAQDSAFGMIGIYIDPSLHETIQRAREEARKATPPGNIAKAALDALEKKFLGAATAQASTLSAAWKDFKMNPGEQVMETFQRFRTLQSQLAAIKVVYPDADVWQTITRGFAGTKYQRICDQANSNSILSGVPLPDLDKLEAALCTEEQKQLGSKGAPRTGTPVMVAGETAAGGRGGRGRGGGGRGGGRGTGRGGLKCWICGGDHLKRDCPKKDNGVAGSSTPSFITVEKSSALTSTGPEVSRADQDEWKWDSCSPRNITPFLNNLRGVYKLDKPIIIEVGGGEEHVATRAGHVLIKTKVEGGGETLFKLKEVLYIPTFKHQLMSTRFMHEAGSGCQVVDKTISPDVIHQHLRYKGRELAMAVWKAGDLPRMRGVAVKEECQGAAEEALVSSLANSSAIREAWELHDAVGHPHHRLLADGISKGLVMGTDVKATTVRELGSCGPCLEGKMKRKPFKAESARQGAWKVAECIHFDYCGPFRVATPEGYDGFVAMTDAATHIRSVVLLKGKSNADVMKAFHQMHTLLRRQGKESGATIKVLRIDSGRETLTTALTQWCLDNGIKPEVTAAHSSQQNGIAESTNRLLMERVRVQLAASKLPKSTWGHVLEASVMQLNRLPCSANPGLKSPWEMYTGQVPSLARFKPLGSEAYILKLPRYRSGAGKLETVSTLGRLVGYSPTSDTWLFLISDGQSRRIIRSRDIRWAKDRRANLWEEEEEEDAQHVGRGGTVRGSAGNDEDDKFFDIVEDSATAEPQAAVAAVDSDDGGDDDGTAVGADVIGDILGGDSGVDTNGGNAAVGADGGDKNQSSDDSSSDDDSDDDEEEPLPKKSEHPLPEKRVRKKVDRYTPGLITMAKDIIPPRNYREMMDSPYRAQWMDAMTSELQSFKENSVMTPVGRAPAGAKVYSTRGVCTAKPQPDGSVKSFKFRIVARGFEQTAEEAGDTYAPTGSLTIFRSILAYANSEGLQVDQMDFKTAFLQAPLKEEVYITLPEGCGEPGVVYKLNRALYGLKQAPRAWYDTLRAGLEEISLLASDADSALFVLRGKTPAENVLIFVHVDDCLISGRSGPVAAVKKRLSDRFDVKDLGPAHFMLGMEIERDWKAGTIKLSQRKYSREVLERFGMLECKPLGGPADKNSKLVKEGGQSLEAAQVELYRSIVGSLMWLSTCTRPDLAQVSGCMGRFLTAPTDQHLIAAKHALRYLAGTKELGILYRGDNGGISIYSDADWGGELDSRRSTTGYVELWGKGAVAWSSHLQKTVAVSTQEAEYQALSAAAREALLARKVMGDFGMKLETIRIFSDNQAAISLAENPMVQARSKHIDIQHHFVRDRVSRGEISLSYIPTSFMIADVLTKAIDPIKVKSCREGMGLF